MSRAFVRESDGAEHEELPERVVSPHRNLVTPVGLALIEAEIARLRAELAQAEAAGERAGIARAARDLRYWVQRRTCAQLVPRVAEPETVMFGTEVTLVRGSGARETFRIVGEDEADPAQGTLAWTSPLARALFGKEPETTVAFRDEAIVIEAVRG